MAETYRIVARQTSDGGVNSERYRVVDDDGNEYCRNAGGGIEDTPSFSLAAERYCELTGADPDTIDEFHSLEIDGVEQTVI
jgi:hypothetical protein